MTRPLKRTGWGQGVYEDSNAKKEIVGTYRMTQDNRGFRYVLAHTTALVRGQSTASQAESDADFVDENVPSGAAVAIGTTLINFTMGGANTITKDELEGGFYWTNDATGEGQMYRIVGNSATVGTQLVIALEHGLTVAIVVTTTQHSFMLNPWSKIVIWGTKDFFPTGVPQAAIGASNYGWSQTHGWGTCWADEAFEAGEALCHADTSGQLKLQGGYTEQTVGYGGPSVGVDGEYMAIFFTID